MTSNIAAKARILPSREVTPLHMTKLCTVGGPTDEVDLSDVVFSGFWWF